VGLFLFLNNFIDTNIMTKKIFKWLGVSLIVVIFATMAFLGYVYWEVKTGRLIYWDGQWYTKAQISTKVGPQVYSVASKNTPEEVYAKFRELLLKGDTEGALGQMTPKSRDGFREAFKDKEKFDKWVKTLPEKLTKERESGNYSFYDVNYGTENKNTATFEKNEQGYWQLDSI